MLKRIRLSLLLLLLLVRCRPRKFTKNGREPSRLTHNANKFVARLHAVNGATLSFIKRRQSIDFEMKKSFSANFCTNAP